MVRRRPAAGKDLRDLARHLGREGSPTIARRFLAAAEATFSRLARWPGLGVAYEPEDAEFVGVRVATVDRFPRLLAFYRPIDGGIEVLRVLHGARDLPAALAEELMGDDTGETDDPDPMTGQPPGDDPDPS